jgi:hypothetical protein
VALLWAGAAAAQTSPYYITDGDAGTMWIVQNGAIQSTITTFTVGEAIAVRNTVMLCDYNEAEAREYTLAGVPTGNTFTGGATYSQLLDGTTDGVQYNYTIAWGSADPNPVLRFDLNWQNPTVLFNLPRGVDAMAITYDTSTGHLYIAFDNEDVIREFDLAGNELGSFDSGLGAGRLACLGYEAATDSLWVKFNSDGTIYNYSKGGTQLAAITVPGLSGFNDWGGEFGAQGGGANIPVLSGWGLAMMALLLAALGWVLLPARR